MKIKIKQFGIITIVAIIAFTFNACENNNDTTHTHQWGAWKSNATQHWKECSCGDKTQVANHTGNPCSVCDNDGGEKDFIWTAVTDSTFATNNYINAVAFGDGKFVAVGENGGKMAYSSDGEIWISVAESTFGTNGMIRDVAYGDGKFVAVGVQGKMAYSSDGINWIQVENNLFYGNRINTITWGNDKFIAGGAQGRMTYSNDGINNWMSVENNTFSDEVYAIAWGNNKFIAGGDQGKIAYSSNGIEWIPVENSTFGNFQDIQSIAHGDSVFVASSSYGGMAYSSDGITWSRANSIFGGHLSSGADGIAWGNNIFVAVGYGVFDEIEETGSRIAYSTNGITWTTVENTAFMRLSSINDVAYGNGKFVAVGAYGQIAYWDGN